MQNPENKQERPAQANGSGHRGPARTHRPLRHLNIKRALLLLVMLEGVDKGVRVRRHRDKTRRNPTRAFFLRVLGLAFARPAAAASL